LGAQTSDQSEQDLCWKWSGRFGLSLVNEGTHKEYMKIT
jgi:hypothetical protein